MSVGQWHRAMAWRGIVLCVGLLRKHYLCCVARVSITIDAARHAELLAELGSLEQVPYCASVVQ